MIDTHHSAFFSFMTSVAAVLMSLWHDQIMKHLPHQQTLRPRYGCTVSSGFFRPAGPTCKQIHHMIGSHMAFWNALVIKKQNLGETTCGNHVYLVYQTAQFDSTLHQTLFKWLWFQNETTQKRRTNSSKCALFFAVVGTPSISYPYMIQYFILFMNPSRFF